MDFIPLNIVSGYRGSVAAGRNFWEGKHQNNSHIPVSDAIVALYQDETARITSVFLTTKRLDDFGITKHETLTLVLRVPTSHAPATVNSILAVVNGFFRFMGWKDIAVKLLKIQKALFCDERRELTRAEYARLVSAAQKVGNERLSLVMQTICATGTRVSELRFITVEAVTTGRAEICNKGKRRTVFLPGRLRRLLRKYLQKQKKTAGAVFTTGRAGRWTGQISGGYESPLRERGRGTRQGIPPQSASFIRKDLLLFGKRPVPDSGHSGPFQREHHPYLYRGEWRRPSAAVRAHGADYHIVLLLLQLICFCLNYNFYSL